MGDHNGLTFQSGDYRKHLPDLNVPRFQTMKKQDAHEYIHDFKKTVRFYQKINNTRHLVFVKQFTFYFA